MTFGYIAGQHAAGVTGHETNSQATRSKEIQG